MSAVNQYGQALMEASSDIRRYREIVMAAINSINQDGLALEFAS